jgi:hypothetical protein
MGKSLIEEKNLDAFPQTSASKYSAVLYMTTEKPDMEIPGSQ